MLSFDEILGQPTVIESLRGLLASGRVPHALLFHGPQGIGKNTTAMAFAASLVCESEQAESCMSCPSCQLVVRVDLLELRLYFDKPRLFPETPQRLLIRVIDDHAICGFFTRVIRPYRLDYRIPE